MDQLNNNDNQYNNFCKKSSIIIMMPFLSSKVYFRSLDFKPGHSKVLEEKTENRKTKFIAKSIQNRLVS